MLVYQRMVTSRRDVTGMYKWPHDISQISTHTHTYIYITCSRRGWTVFLLDHGWVPCVFRGMHDHTCNVDANYHVSHFLRIKITYSCSIMLELLKIFFQSFPRDPYFCVLLKLCSISIYLYFSWCTFSIIVHGLITIFEHFSWLNHHFRSFVHR